MLKHLLDDNLDIQSKPASCNVPKVSLCDLVVGKFVGGGSFCVVHAASVATPPQNQYYDHVVKTVRHEISQDELEMAREDLKNELSILATLSNPNIVGLHGVCCEVNGDIKHLVLDRLDDTLSSRLKQWRGEARRLTSKANYRKSLSCRLRDVAVGIASGLEYLHKQGIVHRDLKPQNIGFDHSGKPVLFDFGLARRIERSEGISSSAETRTFKRVADRRSLHGSLEGFPSFSVSDDGSISSALDSDDEDQQELNAALMQSLSFTESSGVAGTPRYMAPEVARCELYSVSADVYSFTIILWELTTLKIAYEKCTTVDELVKNVVEKKERPTTRGIPSRALRGLMKSSWCDAVDMRPPMMWVKFRLNQIIQELQQTTMSNAHSWSISGQSLAARALLPARFTSRSSNARGEGAFMSLPALPTTTRRREGMVRLKTTRF